MFVTSADFQTATELEVGTGVVCTTLRLAEANHVLFALASAQDMQVCFKLGEGEHTHTHTRIKKKARNATKQSRKTNYNQTARKVHSQEPWCQLAWAWHGLGIGGLATGRGGGGGLPFGFAKGGRGDQPLWKSLHLRTHVHDWSGLAELRQMCKLELHAQRHCQCHLQFATPLEVGETMTYCNVWLRQWE